MNKNFGIVLSCYDKVDDLLAHLDILKFNRRKPKIMVAYLHPDKPPRLPKNVDLLRITSPGFTAGTLVSLTVAMRHAANLGLDYLVYRNADDWLFNHDLANGWIDHMEATGKLAAGYNWFGIGGFDEFSMNENIFSVRHFVPSALAAEKRFLAISRFTGCEHNLPWWIKHVLTNLEEQFFRLPDREQEPGIGWEMAQIQMAWEQKFRETMPQEHWKLLEDNQRFFNKKWQMIGSHDNTSRKHFYDRIRSDIAYADKLEKCRHFGRWLRAAEAGLSWNKPGTNHSRHNLIFAKKKVRTQKAMPKKVFFPKVS